VVGTRNHCALVANGSARDAAFTTAPLDQLPAIVAAQLREGHCRDRSAGEDGSHV
jgi:hypothetical protein